MKTHRSIDQCATGKFGFDPDVCRKCPEVMNCRFAKNMDDEGYFDTPYSRVRKAIRVVFLTALFMCVAGCSVRVQDQRDTSFKVRTTQGEGNNTEVDYSACQGKQVEAGKDVVITVKGGK